MIISTWGFIWQGRPCHLYFDLEFNLAANPGADGEAMVDTLLSLTSQTLLDVFNLEYDPSWTVELDSSTAGTINMQEWVISTWWLVFFVLYSTFNVLL